MKDRAREVADGSNDCHFPVVVENVRKEFPLRGGRDRATHIVFESASFSIGQGEFVSIIGPSGCGKTTMLNIIAGLEHPTSGHISVNGSEVTGPGADRGVVFQQDAIFMWRTVRRNVEFGLEIQKMNRDERRARADDYIQRVGLQGFEDFYPKELSGGMKKRVAIAAVLANKPAVMLMDEPFGSLDYSTKVALQEEISRIVELEKTTTLFVTHDLEEAIFLSDRVLVLANKRVAEDIRIARPRPRGVEFRTSEEMSDLKRALWEYL